MLENLGSEFVVNKFQFNGYKIGSFVFSCEEIKDQDGNLFIEVAVYKYSNPVLLYVKTYKAPNLEGASNVDLCEALYEEFYLNMEDK